MWKRSWNLGRCKAVVCSNIVTFNIVFVRVISWIFFVERRTRWGRLGVHKMEIHTVSQIAT